MESPNADTGIRRSRAHVEPEHNIVCLEYGLGVDVPLCADRHVHIYVYRCHWIIGYSG